MSVEDVLAQGFVSSIASNNYSHASDLSPEDAAWVDSCLVKNPELSESSWDSMKECLLDIISSETHSNFSTSVVENGSLETSSSRDVLMSEEAEMTQGNVAAKYANDAAKADKEEMDLIRGFLLKDMSKFCDQEQGDLEGDMAELGLDLSHTSSMDVLMGKEAGKSQSHVAVGHESFKALEFPGGDADEKEDSVSEKEGMGLFRGILLKDKSKIREGKQDNKVAEVDLDMNQTDEIEQLPEDIFKVWDLETPVDEEDELVKQLEEALTESSLTTQPLADSLGNNFDTGALDSLISGIADLSLQSISGF